MLKKLVLFLCVLLGFTKTHAVILPEISTPDKNVWYLIQFLNQGNVLEARSNGEKVTTARATGSDAQLWKVEGDEHNGFKLTSKTNMVLYVSAAEKNGRFFAGNAPSQNGNELFQLAETAAPSYTGSGGLEIQPKANNTIAMNQFGGAGVGKELGLWSINDDNNPLKFVSLKEFNAIGKYGIIPYPASLKEIKEDSLSLKDFTAIICPDLADIQHAVTEFATDLERASGIKLAVKKGQESTSKAINLIVDNTLKEEAYKLDIQDDRIIINAAEGSGFFYGIQTLKQLLPRSIYGTQAALNDIWEIPFVCIEDQPKMHHRGFMLDVARHFFSKEEVKRIIDMMATYKLNILHWHLTDDQGWRFEIPEYPLLTEVGSIRSGSFVNPGDGSGKFFDDTEYGRGMWYSQEDLKEIVAYAQERYIDIIPEVDFPGHMVAAITAYPELSCDPSKKYSVRLDSGISKDVLNLGNDKVIDFLKCIIDNMAKIFPYKYVHFGGDECPVDQWRTNEECLQRVKEEGLSGVEQLQSWLIEELGIYIQEKYQKEIIVWDELLSHWNDKNTVKPIIMAWNSIDKMREAANRGFKSIATPHSHVYVDMMQVWPNDALVDEPYNGGWSDTKVITLETTYSLNPLSALSGKEDFGMGVQANMWTETCNDSLELEYQVFPRLLALSEIGWLPTEQKDWNSFHRRIQSHALLLDLKGINYAKHYFTPKELTESESALKEAKDILEKAVRGGVGYPEAEIHDKLSDAYSKALDNSSETNVLALKTATENYKKAAITMPQAGKIYQIISASTYYKQQYAGSSMYQSGDEIRIHYTPQTEPEELWTFEESNGHFIMKNYGSGKMVQMNRYNANSTLSDQKGTEVRIDKATIENKEYTFIPGTVTISAVAGYTPEASGEVKRLTGSGSGFVMNRNEPKLCSASTWYLVEVNDFRKQLEGLIYKSNRIAETPLTGEIGEPTQEAVDFLKENVVIPGNRILSENEPVTEEIFTKYMLLYNEFQAMPKKTLLSTISEEYYYRIQNAHFSDKYAFATTENVVPQNIDQTQDGFLWYFKKIDNDKVMVYSKVTQQPAYINMTSEGQTIKVNESKSNLKKWGLEEISTDQSQKGIALVDPSGIYSWYTNPSSFPTILTKPKTWGASIWNLIKTDIKVISTGIDEISETTLKNTEYYDLNGRSVKHPKNGIFITHGKKVLIK